MPAPRTVASDAPSAGEDATQSGNTQFRMIGGFLREQFATFFERAVGVSWLMKCPISQLTPAARRYAASDVGSSFAGAS
jgi:hypothetical protein